MPPDIDHHAREQGVEFVKLYGLEPVKTCVCSQSMWMCGCVSQERMCVCDCEYMCMGV